MSINHYCTTSHHMPRPRLVAKITNRSNFRLHLLEWIVSLLGAACLLLGASPSPAQDRPRPVLVIPGIMGSKICDKANKLVWGDISSTLRERLVRLSLPLDSESYATTPLSACGVIEQVNIIPFLWRSDQYNVLLDTLREIRPSQVIEFPYDWRLSNFVNADRLKEFIDKKIPPPEKFDIVAHSMGGLIGRIYLQKLGGNARVVKFVTIGTPHLGSNTVFQRLKEGLEITPPVLSGGLAQIQRVILTFPSIYQLLPSYDDCCAWSVKGNNSDAKELKILNPSTWQSFSWLPTEFRSGRGAAFIGEQLSKTKELQELLSKPIEPADGNIVKSYFIANGLVKTWSRVYFDPQNGQITGHADSDGDGTVLFESASAGNPDDAQVSNRDHQHLFVGDEPKLMLTAFLSNRFWHNQETPKKVLVDAKGSDVPILNFGVSLMPPIVLPGQDARIAVSVFTKETLQSTDLSNISVQIDAQPAILDTSNGDSQPTTDPTERRLFFKYSAPSQEGAYSVTISIPGIKEFKEQLLVSTLD
jgi:Lecithin:cholesterol acyltransferase